MRTFIAASILALTMPFAFGGGAHAETPAMDVIVTYANIADAMYGDAVTTAQALQAFVDGLIAQTRAVEGVVAALGLTISV